MRQRGRHRRRRRGRVLRAVLSGTALALTAAATLISVSQAANTGNPGALQPLTSTAELGRLQLREQRTPASTLNRLARSMGRPVGVTTVLRDADHTMRGGAACGAARADVLPVAPAAAHAWCWDRGDATTSAWQARSVTTSGDADDDGLWGGHRVILAGWTRTGSPSTPSRPAVPARPTVSAQSAVSSRADDRGLARVAFVDADDPVRPTYSWALLTVPVDGGRDYRGLVSRVSGMTWYQDKLFVTADGDGNGGGGDVLYVYDVRRVQRATVRATSVGRTRHGWAAHGYRWVLPAVASYRYTGGACGPAEDQAPCPGALSLDRSSTPDSLVLGERTPAGSDRPARLWRYSFTSDPARPGLLATGADGLVRATEAYRTKAAGIRGVLSHRPGGGPRALWYVGVEPAAEERRGAAGERGELWRQDDDGARAARCGGATRDAHRCWGGRAQALSYARGAVWSLTEPSAGERASGAGRMLFTVPLRAIDGSLGRTGR